MNGKVSTTFGSLSEVVRAGLKSTVACNAASLYVIQFANYIVPLIMVPYLVRVLGPAGYGAVAFAQGFINYLMLFVEYGFDWSATRKISVMREDLGVVNQIALHVWATKGLLSLVGLAVLLLLIAVVPKLKEATWLLLALYGLVLGNVLFPTWLFQGMERMVVISLINLGMKLGVLIGVFILVKRPEDALIYAALMGVGSLMAGLTGAVFAVRMFDLGLKSLSCREVLDHFRDGLSLFLSKASLSLFYTNNAFLVGILSNDYATVGYYSAAEKIVMASARLLEPISLAIYPRISYLKSLDTYQALKSLRKAFIIMGILSLAVMTIILLGGPVIVDLVLSRDYQRSLLVLRILSGWLILNTVTNVWGVQILVAFNYYKKYFISVLLAGVINIVLAIYLVPLLQEVGMAISVLCAGILLASIQAYFISSSEGITPMLKKQGD